MAKALKEIIKENAFIIKNINDIDLSPFSSQLTKATVVLLGESSHGTDEFYRIRSQITQKLIKDYGFNAVAVESDWPDQYQINRFVQDMTPKVTAKKALSSFKRFPTWMWRNKPFMELINWMRRFNDDLKPNNKVGIYGLDLYSLESSIHEVIKFLDKVDPDAAEKAKENYMCLSTAIHNPELYGLLSNLNLTEECRDSVVQQLTELNKRAANFVHDHAEVQKDEYFNLVQNAHLIKSAESYYRNMFNKEVFTWNLRDQHMFDTLQNIQNFLSIKQQKMAKVIVWAHNSHIGNAKSTDMGKKGEFNIGQLVKETYGEHSFSLGFTTYTGKVMAADTWGDQGRIIQVKPALAGSYEEIFHDSGLDRFILPLNKSKQIQTELHGPYLERAIGVIYRPHTERGSHYFNASLTEQFDAVCHIDTTSAIELIEKEELKEVEEEEEIPNLYPTGI